MDALPLTGERTVPGVWQENYWFRRHEVAYRFLRPYVTGRQVLEVGCGEGYGSALLARAAAEVLGIDYDPGTVAHAATRYPRVRFVRANLAALPAPSRSFDMLTTLQVIEHVWNHAEFLGECRRVLRPGGLLVVTTPNRLTFSAGAAGPLNPFHTEEFTATELTALLRKHGFAIDRVCGVHAGERLARLDLVHAGSFVRAQLGTSPDHWDGRLADDVRSVTAQDFVINDDRVDASLDLLVLAHRPAG